MLRLSIVLLFALPVLAQERTITTEHYELHLSPAIPGTEEYAQLIEAAWPEFEQFFKARPKLPKGARLSVRIDRTREAWAKALQEIGATAPDGAGGMYWPQNKTAYLYEQPTNYYTRVLLLHEVGHQFHYLSRTRNKDPAAAWYTEAVVEFLAAHFWDGKQLQLGVRPVVSLKDYAAQALKRVESKEFVLQQFVEGQAKPSRPVGWALYRYLATGDGGKPLRNFRIWSRKMDGGNRPGPVFKKYFGRGKALQDRFVAWLEEEQEPWSQIWNEWQGIGRKRLRGFASVVSAARPKQTVTQLAATLEPPRKGRWLAGALLHYSNRDDFSVAFLDWGGFLRIQRRANGRWQTIERGQGPPKEQDGSYKLQLFRKQGKVYLMIGKQGYGPWELPGNVLGLALENCDVRFREISWR